jgi:hypothetical protein
MCLLALTWAHAPALQAQPASPAQSLTLAVIGDFGQAGLPAEQVAQLVKSWSPDAVLSVGDNNYPAGSAETIDENIGQYYAEFIGNYQGAYGSGASQNRFFTALGNHDIQNNSTALLDYLTLPGNERYYAVNFGAVDLFFLNSNLGEVDGWTADSAQAMWLKSALLASTAAWQIVLFHHPPFASGEKELAPWMEWQFATGGVDLVLNGHHHVYERLEVGGLTYVVNGLGGGAIYNFAETAHPNSLVRYNSNWGALRLTVDEYQLMGAFITRDGTVIDQFGQERPRPTATPTATPLPTATPTLPPTATPLPTATFTASPTVTPPPSPTAATTPPPPLPFCPFALLLPAVLWLRVRRLYSTRMEIAFFLDKKKAQF